MKSIGYQVLARKWRPRRFEDVIGQSPIVRTLSNALNQQRLHQAYLLTGPSGVGKTSIARILVKCFNCEKGISANPCHQCAACQAIDDGHFPDLYEIDAASRTKVEDTRELLENVPYAPAQGRFKVYLIDEVHMLSNHSFNALLKTLEEPPAHVLFLLATTDYQKLPVTVLSRCLQFHLNLLSPQEIAPALQAILQQENIPHEMEAVVRLSEAAEGSLRDALSLLDQCIAYGNGHITENDVKALLGTIEPTLLFTLLEALYAQKGDEVMRSVSLLASQGVQWPRVLADLLALLHQIAVLQIVPDAPLLTHQEPLRRLARQFHPEDVQLFYQIGLSGQRDLPFAPTAQMGIEMTLLRMLAFYPTSSAAATDALVTHTPQKTDELTPITMTSPALNWHELIPQLNLSGAALALASQCSLKEITDTHMLLLLNPKQKPLLQPKQIQRINEALNHYWQRTVSVRVVLGEHEENTPATIAQHNQQERQLRAEKTIMGNQRVQQMIEAFDATVIKESIIPRGESNV